jgi:hypothetical protein
LIFLRYKYVLNPLLLENNYVTWLTTSAAGSGILFAVISQSISKGKNESFTSKALRFTRGKAKED